MAVSDVPQYTPLSDSRDISPDIPPFVTVKPGQTFKLECIGMRFAGFAWYKSS